jgi:quercetin dioxygenase-like cupin family protein
VFWHVYQYPSRVAAQAVKPPQTTVVESFGNVWLFAIADSKWQASGGKPIAVIGPLLIRSGTQYTARYMEAVFPPGMQSRNLVHRHSGPEAWYVLTGTQCLETPEGATVVGPGQSGVVPEGPPMSITAVGNEVRRSLVLVLHDSTQAWTTMASDWQPRGLCPK